MRIQNENKTLCEFFAGIGLVWEGLRGSGWRCIYSNDIDARKKRVFESHFGESGHFHLGDIWNTADVVSRIGERPFLATASFPCTDLSLAGYNRGLSGKESNTYFGFLKVIEALGERRPSAIMLENVPSFLTSGQGKDFPLAMNALADLGYWIDAFIVDAKHFVPQSRPRLFIVAVHESSTSPLMLRESRETLWAASPWWEAIEASGNLHTRQLKAVMQGTRLPTGWFTTRMTAPTGVPKALKDIIDLGKDQDWWDAERVRIHYERMHDYCRADIDKLVKDRATFISTAYRRTRKGVVRTEVRFDGIAGCLRTTKGGSARQIVIVVNKGKLQMRWMSPREYARLQGAGDYRLVGKNENEQMFGFGDAVCVPVIEWIDRTVLTPLFDTITVQKSPRRTKALAV
jgi:DNA (cytosine-5)-methyltransferase 1